MMKRLTIVATIVCGLYSSLLHAQESWEKHLQWSARDSGVPDCPAEYRNYGAKGEECLVLGIGGGTGQGNRKCLMAVAGIKGSENQCGIAYQMVLTTQCHNPEAQAELRRAGQEKICSWLSGKK